MASRKTPTKPPSEAAFVVVLEDIRAQNKVFGEALESFREQVDRRFDQVDQRLGRLETDTRLIKLAVVDLGAELKTKVNREEVEGLVERARLSR